MKFLSRVRRHAAVRVAGRTVMIAVALLAAAIVSSLTIDLGPGVRGWAEREGSAQVKRPIRIGRLSLHVLSGRVLVEDFSIAGLSPADRPFFTARRLAVGLDWRTLFHREVTIDAVELTDWRMLVEHWEDRHNFPKFTSDDEPDKPKRFTTTLKLLHAGRGEFAFEDHEKRWSTVARNIDLTITNLPEYHGEVAFSGGTVAIQDYVPMWANMRAGFTLDKGKIHLGRIDLQTDGATTVATGEVDLRHWPEQTYQVKSRVRFPRMREIFFGDETWRVAGDADFTGTFHLFKNGHDLYGTFASDLAAVDDYQFPALRGALRWTPAAFEIREGGSRFYGGSARFAYAIRPLGSPAPATHRFDFDYADVDLSAFTDFEALRGVRFAGAASGHNHLEWTGGRFEERRGDGRIAVAPPRGTVVMTPAGVALSGSPAAGRDAPPPLTGHLPIAGELAYRFDHDATEIDSGFFATERTHVAFQGTTAWGEQSRFPFHVVSADWQESDRVLAGILTDFGAPTGPVAFAGRGEFDGLMTGAFRRPRVEGVFSGDDLRAWDTRWGAGAAHIVVENGYVAVSDGLVRDNGSEIRADGMFSLGFPREDGGQEIDARFRVAGRDLAGLRHAFRLDDYPVTGRMSGEFHLTGAYERPIGFGAMTIEEGTAYGEPFQRAAASLRLDGTGVRLDAVTVDKGAGTVTGAAFVGWDSTYSFNAVGRQIPAGSIVSLSLRQAPLAGFVEFSAAGSGTFDAPQFDVRFQAGNVSVGGEPVGQVTGSLQRRGRELSGQVDLASPRLAMTGTGRIALTPQADAELTFRFHDSLLDPYVRLFVPRLSPFTTAVATGTVRVAGELADFDHLLVDGVVDSLDMRLFDYALRNAAPIRMSLDRRVVKLDDLRLAGDGTSLRLSGSIGLKDQRIALRAEGDASLGILQGFYKDVRSSGHATLTAAIQGPLGDPALSGRAVITDGRIRHFSLPNSLDAINGAIGFDATGIRLDELTAKMGDGVVRFGGHVGLKEYAPSELDVTARGEGMRLRYPAGVQSTIDADLILQGNVKAPTLGGTVTVKNAFWTRPFEASGGIFDLAGRRASADVTPAATAAATAAPPSQAPLRFDLNILVPSTLHISNDLIRQLTASAELKLLGTTDRPLLSGRADVERGELVFNGRRYKLTRGTIEFNNPMRIDPFFDVEAETNVRVPGQTYHVVASVTGTSGKIHAVLQSDPYLPQADVLVLLLSEARPTQGSADVELRALQNPNQRQTDILTTQATAALASPISQNVGKVVEQTFGVDTFQLTPFIDPYSQQPGRVNPAARVTIGKRISDRVYLTFSRSLNTPVYDQIILLEYDESDRLSWVLSRNEDQSYALEFRVRHVF